MKIIETLKWLALPADVRRAKRRHAYERELKAQGHTRKEAARLAWLKYGARRDEKKSG